MKWLIVLPAVLLGAAMALYIWAARQPNVFAGWREAYD